MNTKLSRIVFYVVCLAGIMAACNDDKYGGPSPYEVNTTYTNQLSAGNKASLALLYNGETLIGKEVYFKLEDSQTGYLSLKQILPGEQETNIDNIALTTDGDSYSFRGTTTTATGTSLVYTGKVEIGKLTLTLSDVNLSENPLKGKPFQLVKYGEVEYKRNEKKEITQYHSSLMLRMQPNTPFGKDQALLSMFFPVINSLAIQLGGTSLGIVLNKVRFGTDGNITAHYADWPEGLDLMDAAGYQRPNDDYTASPANLATYYFTDAETMFVVPNIDQIIYTIEQNAIKRNRSLLAPEMQEFLKKLYAQLAIWARYGIRFKAIPNPYTGDGYAPIYKFEEGNRVEDPNKAEQYEGDYLLQIDTGQLAIVGVVMEALPYLAPELCETKLADIPALAEYAGLIPLIFPGTDTVGSLLTALKTLGDNLDFEIGLLLNNQVNQ